MCPMASCVLRRHYDSGTLIYTLNIHISLCTHQKKKKERGINVTPTNDMTGLWDVNIRTQPPLPPQPMKGALRVRKRLAAPARSHRPPTCLKQKGMVSTLTPTMLFTTFMMRPELDAVIVARLKASPPSVKKRPNQGVRRSWRAEQVSASQPCLSAPRRAPTDRLSRVFRITPPTCDVAVCENTNTRELAV